MSLQGSAIQPPGPLIYTGRRRDVTPAPGAVALSSWDALPVRLGPLLAEAEHLTVLDPMSFPFDSLRDSDRDVPIDVELPEGRAADWMADVFGAPLLDHLTPFDCVSITDDAVWEDLRDRYSLAATIRVAEKLDPRRADHGLDASIERDSARRRKSEHRLLCRAIRTQLAAAWAAVPVGEAHSALLMAGDPDQWMPVIAKSGARVEAPSPVSDAATESVHASVCVGALCAQEPDERERRLSALLCALRIGGRLIVAERFLDGRRGEEIGAPAPRQLLAEVRTSSAGHLVLEHVESLRCRQDSLTSWGLFAFTKLGRPERL